ncbi:hypothetical protein IQ224_18705 [Microcystis sp. LEGE 00066]|uniref:Uncharacterized protein n=1 Tax=Microcystis aeruginosa PCC 7806SL TaxID=1903187 RepID=A0AB33C1Q2_MICA7|nr:MULTISPECIES: hypothetical protein [Microcystis]ARI81653.1 hypothetical protein BH695_2372 [Microcystis aeruginosa PCC 7806SL]ARI82103.1 hypothetical protein BH695_2824 [Microcystis aeruginosa PCC 7806SL]ARI84326.1 hypothetical protein BH695_5047 [Microcystis aeruginosa PCC 7806SL]ELS45278.1 hypothetical protein C789_4902 [Microcystis aeruginosa FACHB-905 = DIANCHI905]MBE9264086.1 hypothetical protein [Microcystis sp. LEGE 00066]
MTQELLTENAALKQRVSELELEIERIKKDMKELILELDKKGYSSLYRD